MRLSRYVLLASGVGIISACGSSDNGPENSGTAGTGGSSTAGSAVNATTGAGGETTSSGGSSGSSSGTGGSATGAGGATVDSGNAVVNDASTGNDAGSSGLHATAGCAGKDYALCIDFENGIDTATWTGGSTNAIVTTDFAHGGHSYRLYPMSGGLLKATKLGTIKDQIWGRFYVHFNPGAPGGHGNIVAAFDQSNNWYEMGWQFDAMMGVWHQTGGAERPLRSTPLIVDQWYCVELFFDGTKTDMPRWWLDGNEVMYYMAANTTLIPKVVQQFQRIEVGFTPYAMLGLQMPDGKGPPDSRVLTNMWIDDIAFDTKRIGCIDGPVGK
jgi:hypothetical protein